MINLIANIKQSFAVKIEYDPSVIFPCEAKAPPTKPAIHQRKNTDSARPLIHIKNFLQ